MNGGDLIARISALGKRALQQDEGGNLDVTRRNLLIGAGTLASGLVLRSPLGNALADAQNAPPEKKLKVIVTGGHPGDPEYGCGGTVARLTALGHEVVLLYLK